MTTTPAAPSAATSAAPRGAAPRPPFATTWGEVCARLAAPFAPDDIEWRVQTAGEKNGKPWARVLAYVTNRAIMERLDAVLGPGCWENAYTAGPAGGILCGLRVWLPDAEGTPTGTPRTKWDGAENTDIESVKGGLSNAMKRAAVQWGIGRYLYDLEEGWAVVHDGGRFSARTKDGKWFKWDPPSLPEWATPRPAVATPAQLAHIETLVARLDAKTQAATRRRLASGLSAAAADDAIRFLEARIAVDTESATPHAAPAAHAAPTGTRIDTPAAAAAAVGVPVEPSAAEDDAVVFTSGVFKDRPYGSLSDAELTRVLQQLRKSDAQRFAPIIDRCARILERRRAATVAA